MSGKRGAHRHAALVLALVALAWAAVAGAQGRALGPTTWPAFPLTAIEPGMLGYGLTEGPAGIERFDVEVLALQEGFGLGFPLVLVRASGGVVAAGGGVSAGMSGSPVVLGTGADERLLGAIGYVFADSVGGLALVTPIGAMRDGGGAGATLAPLLAHGAVPVATPLLVSGLGARALALLQSGVLASGATPVQAVQGGGGRAVATEPLGPGSAVAVQWVRGDVDIGAVGTVTEVDGDRVLAFGHPVLGIGPVDWPLARAAITAVVANRTVPFKLANTARGSIGAIDQDRPAAIGGRLGGAADLLPVTLTVAYGDTTEALRFEVVRDEALWPTLVAVATLEGLDRVRARVGEGTATLHWDVAFPTGPGLRLSEAVVDDDDVATAAARLAGGPLALLAANPFEATRPTRLALLVRIEDRRRDVEVRRATVNPDAFEAGAVVPLLLRLQPWRRPGEVRALDVRLPDDLHGRVELVVRGGTFPREADGDGPPDPDDAPLTFDELLAFLRDRPGGGDLVVEARADGGPWVRLERLALSGYVTGRVDLTLDVAPPADEPTETEETP
ncbi:MAG: hypothetical protein ABR510_07570 [Trueperaceae bacterium]